MKPEKFIRQKRLKRGEDMILQSGSITCIHGDCMDYIKDLPDKAYDLAIVDPPYGIGQNWAKNAASVFYRHRNNFNNSIPDEEYFSELFRTSAYQIIWGCNYYWNYLTPTNNLIFWDKGKDTKTQFGSAGELAWTNITKYPLIKIELMWNGCCTCERTKKCHPHQKPVALYKWLLTNYAKPGYKILDIHGGSFSHAIAAHDLGFELTIIEKDKDYFDAAVKRLKTHQRQLKLF